MSEARTLWEEGHELGHQVAALGFALAITVASLDLTLGSEVGQVFDVAFVLVCVLVAILVRPEDFFTVGVLPPLIMLAVIGLVAISRPGAVADRGAPLAEAVVNGLSDHAVALAVGYALCLLCLAIRERFTRDAGVDREVTRRSG